MSFFEKLDAQRRAAQNERQRLLHDQRTKEREKYVQIEQNYSEWYKHNFLPVWRLWRKLDVDKKVEAAFYTFTRYSLVIFKDNWEGYFDKQHNDPKYSWSTHADLTPITRVGYEIHSNQSHPLTGQIARAVSRGQNHRFKVGGFFSEGDFSLPKIRIHPKLGDPIRLGVSGQSVVQDSYRRVYVTTDERNIVIGGKDTVRFNPDVSVTEFDNALFDAVQNPSVEIIPYSEPSSNSW
jgi:hypothetical protein